VAEWQRWYTSRISETEWKFDSNFMSFLPKDFHFKCKKRVRYTIQNTKWPEDSQAAYKSQILGNLQSHDSGGSQI